MLSLKSFPAKLVFETSSFLDERSRHSKAIEDHTFVHGIDVIIPNVTRAPVDVQAWPGDATYYKVVKLRLENLVDKEFIGAFVKRGTLCLLSVGTDVDIHDCIALLPCGTLILNVTKDTYEELGLEGQPSKFNKNRKKKFVIEVNLTAKNFAPGSRLYERTLRCFRMRRDLTFDCLISWIPQEDRICSSSIAKYFESKEFEVTPCDVHSDFQTTYSGSIPRIKPEQWVGDSESGCIDYNEFLEWSGGVSCQIDGEKLCPEDSSDPVGQIVCATWRGFLTPTSIKVLLDILRSLVNPDSSIPWAVMTAHGFEDSPVSFSNREHGYHKNGDNIQSFVIFPHGQYWKYTALSTHDVVP